MCNVRRPTLTQIVIDADEMLTTSFGNFDKDPNTYPPYHWFSQNQMLIKVTKLHILHPGTFEFIRYVLNRPHIKLIFMAAWAEEKLKQYVDRLLSRILGNEQYEAMRDKVGFILKDGYAKPTDFLDADKFKLFKQNSEALKNKYFTDHLKLDSTETTTFFITRDVNLQCAALNGRVITTPGAGQTHFEHFYQRVRDNPSAEDFKQTNHVFYITGMLAKFLEEGPQPTFMSQNSNEIYLKGLQILQTISPALAFHGGNAAIEYFRQAFHDGAASHSLSNYFSSRCVS